MSQNLLKISSFDLHTSLQMCVPLVNCRESSLCFSRTALSYTEPTTLHCLVSRAGNITAYITRSNSSNINSVEYTICGIAHSMPTSSVCSKRKGTEAASVRCLLRHGIEHRNIDSAVNEWHISLQACLQLKEKRLSNF